MNDNYPPGAANDPRAPWNQVDPIMTEWENCGPSQCESCDETVDCNDQNVCADCFKPVEVEDDE